MIKKKSPKPPAVPTENRAASKPPATRNRSVANRWTPALATSFTPVSDYFLESYHRIKPAPPTHGEAMFVVHLMRFKWDEKPPYPAFKTLAKQMGISDQQARKLARSLEQKKLLRRSFRPNLPNLFHLEPLFRALELMLANDAKEAAAKEKAGKERAA
jgi:hypothetical protein